MPTDTLNIPELAAEFTVAHPRLDAPEQRLALALFRLLGEGKPVGLEDLAERSGLPAEEVAARLEAWPMVHRDAQGRVFAFGGLTLEPTAHLLEVGGRTLYAWCALDTLFLPELLGRPARIRSTCPQTGETITLGVDAAGVRDAEPEGAVMSLHGASGLDLDDVVATFCCFVHFFATEDAARAWTGRRKGTYIVSIAEGFEYGHLYNQGRFGAALAESRA